MESTKCIKFQHDLFDNLNIAYNILKRTIVFWNKYQIFLFDEVKYENLNNVCRLMYLSEFKIAQLILSDNYIICLDYSGNIHISSLKLKRPANTSTKSSFQVREDGILSIDYNENKAFSLKKETSGLYFCIHKICSDFQMEKKIKILNDDKPWPSLFNCRNKCIFRTHLLNETEFSHVKDIFITKGDQWNNHLIVIISFDKLTLYAFLLCLESPELNVTLVHLFTCPSQINNVSFVNDICLCVIVSLASGTVIKLPLNNELKAPTIVHLNTAIDKLLVINKDVIYTDGNTMWKSENTFSESNISFRQLTVRHIKDFIKVVDQIVCTTYTKLIYLIPLDEETCYLEPPTTDDYCPSEHLINNCDYLYSIMEEIKKNDEIIKNIKKEENYLSTLALSNRVDVMDEMIDYNVIVFESYEDILKEDIPLTLTNRIEDYFDMDSFYFLIKLTTTYHLQQKFSDILSNLFGNLKIHITLLSEQKVQKTHSIKVEEQLKNTNIVIPLSIQMLNLTNVTINIELATHIPAALNEKKVLWVTLHCKKILLNSEHFIKNNFLRNNVFFLKEPKKSIKELIYETACNHHGQMFKVNQVSIKNDQIKWPFYVKLPTNYEESLSNITFYINNFNTSKANYLFKEISSEEFLKSRSNLCFIIANERVEVEILNDGIFDPLLRVTSQNPEIALGMRNFFANLAHNTFKSYEREFVSDALYESIENMEQLIKVYIPQKLSTEEFLNFFDRYQRNIMGALVI